MGIEQHDCFAHQPGDAYSVLPRVEGTVYSVDPSGNWEEYSYTTKALNSPELVENLSGTLEESCRIAADDISGAESAVYPAMAKFLESQTGREWVDTFPKDRLR